MADETKDRGEGSKNGPAPLEIRPVGAAAASEGGLSLTGPGDGSKIPPSPAPAIPEPVILEETVVKPAPAEKKTDTGTPSPVLQKTPPPASSAAPVGVPASRTPAPPTSISAAVPPTPTEVLPPMPPEMKRAVEEITLATKVPLPPQGTPPLQSLDAVAQKQRVDAIVRSAPLPERRGVVPEAHAAQPSSPLPESASPLPPAEAFVDTVTVPLRTLKNDLQAIVKTKKMSLVRAAALEQEKKRDQLPLVRDAAAQEKRRGRAFKILFTALTLALLGAGAFFAVYTIERQRSNPPIDDRFSSILFAENTVTFPIAGQTPLEVKRLLGSARTATAGSLGSITRIVPTFTDEAGGERAATFSEFNAALGSRIPSELLRALSGEFFFGVHTVDENAPVLIIPVEAYERAFAATLAWEATMNADLAPLFASVPDQITGANGLPEKRRFEDLVIRNYDVRALKDDAGVVQLYYSFPNQNILIIAESVYSFKEILSRLKAERRL